VKDARLALYDAAAGKPRAEIRKAGEYSPYEGVFFTQDGRTLIMHTDRVRLFDTADGKLLREFAPGTEPANYYRKIFTGHVVYTYDSTTGGGDSYTKGPSNEDELMVDFGFLPTVGMVAKILVGGLPKFKPPTTQVWRIDDNWPYPAAEVES
jgi:hypothetical protein